MTATACFARAWSKVCFSQAMSAALRAANSCGSGAVFSTFMSVMSRGTPTVRWASL